jgi:peptidoglycan L-alanyl-D-glutamate endopeptidase CwlK
MASTKLTDLHPNLVPLAEKFLFECRDHGLNIKVTCTYRSPKEQDKLYSQGRTIPGNIVTNAQGGDSEHNFEIDGTPASKAFDIVPIVNEKAIWDTNSPEWKEIGQIWRGIPIINGYWLDWYGKPLAKFSEKCHFCLKKSAL